MDFIRKLPANKVGKDYIVGDLHGCYDHLMAALTAIGFDYEVDRLFSVGDLIDRGSQNAECLHLLTEDWFFAVRGNHEMMMYYSAMYWEQERIWLRNGGDWATQFPQGTIDVWRHKIKDLPGIIIVGTGKKRFNILHAEPEFSWGTKKISNKTLEETTGPEDENPERSLYWGRQFIRHPDTNPNMDKLSRTYVGHTTTKQLVHVGPIYYLDRGAVFENETHPTHCLAIACHTDGVVHEYYNHMGELRTVIMSDIPDVLTFVKQ